MPLGVLRGAGANNGGSRASGCGIVSAGTGRLDLVMRRLWIGEAFLRVGVLWARMNTPLLEIGWRAVLVGAVA